MKTIYATDLDGTLLGSNASLSDYTARALRQLVEHGIPVTYITARTPATVQPIMAAAPPLIPGVVMTGAALWNSAACRYERVTYHTAADVEVIAEICRRHGVNPFVYTLEPGSNSLVVYHEAEVMSPIEHEFVVSRTLNDLKSFELRTTAPEATRGYTVLFFAMGDPGRLKAAAEEIHAATGCSASCYPDTYHQGLGLLEIFTRGVSKAGGIDELRRVTGADRVVAFGDNLNDIPMMRRADVAVAVANAHPDVKAVADIVIGSCDDDSVVKYIISQESRVKSQEMV